MRHNVPQYVPHDTSNERQTWIWRCWILSFHSGQTVQIMPSIWSKRIVGSRQVRTSAQSALTSGEASHSRIQASENSRASAAAVAELADGLDFLFETLDFEGAILIM
jgi:hypothetical protein